MAFDPNDLESLYRKTPAMMHALDAHGRICFVSNRWLARFGYTRDEVLGRRSVDFLTPDSRRMAVEVMVPAFYRDGHVENAQLQFVTKTNEVVDVLLSGDCERDEAGHIIFSRAVLVDVTSENRWKRNAERRAQLLESFFKAIPDGTILTDSNRTILRLNPAAEALFEQQEADLKGQSSRVLYADEEAFHQAMRRKADDGGALEPQQIRFLRGRDRFFIAETVSARFTDEQGELAGHLKIIRDISERLQMEAEQQALQQQVLHAQKTESLGALAGGIAHHFNNLLVAILGNVDLALQDISRASTSASYLSDISSAARRAADLCRQMLAYAGRGKFHTEKLDLSHLVRDMSQILDISISKNSMLQLELEDNLPLIVGDGSQLRQVLMNLILNGAEALEDQNGCIRVRTGVMYASQEDLDLTLLGAECQEGNYVFAEVRDTGVGMSHEVLDRLFDPFFTTKFVGRGLGLAAVLGIVRGHFGTLRVVSEAGSGTTFRVMFPVDEEAGSDGQREGPPSLNERPSARGSVLLADDEASGRAVTQHMLSQLGFEVTLVKNGGDALELLRTRAKEFSLVILALSMPHLNDHRELHRQDPEPPVLLVSGYTEKEVSHRFADLSLFQFLQKPFTMAELKHAVEATLGEA